MIRKLYKITALVFALGLSVFSHATKETYSVRKNASDITTGLSFEVIDGRFAELGLGGFYDKSTRFLLKFGIEERQSYGYFASEATIDALITIEALGPIGDVLDSKTGHLIINYNPAGGVANTVDLDAVLGDADWDYHRYRVTIDGVTLTGVASIPDYVFIEGELQVDRFYDLDTENPPTLATVFMAYDFDDNSEYAQTGISPGGETGLFPYGINAQEVQLYWSYIEGAEEYELEWTWVDNYSGDGFGTSLAASDIAFSERDFELNNTRVITSAQSYRIPLIYAKGYLIYRVRAVGRWTDNDLEDTDKLYFGPWTSDGFAPVTVASWPHYIQISDDHEALKNWQYQAVYAEEGKKKEIVSYFDGSLRNRQTVTRINSNNEAIVGENVYDNQGRSAIQILPTPVENAALRYYLNLNKNTEEDIYTHYDFDWDTGECLADVTAMSTASGASRYYSDLPSAINNWQDYVPNAEGIPFVQVEYTPDNTGRIRRQSGVGSAYAIDGERITEYFYSQPDQVELYRLFGYHVGNAQHYKKNIVVDANGQVSISIIDPQGRVIATALAGNNETGTEGETITNLLSLDEHDGEQHDQVNRDLLNKLAPGAVDTEADNNHRYVTGKQGAIADALLLNTQHGAVDAQTHEFNYSVTTDRFRDECMPLNTYYPFAYDLNIDLRDDCGNERFIPYDHDDDSETPTVAHVSKTIGGATSGYLDALGTSFSITDEDLYALLQTGTYSLSKLLQVNADTLEQHLAHYLAHLEPACLPDFFEDNTDCEGDEYPEDFDEDALFDHFSLTTCVLSTKTMLNDLMPSGQFGATDGEDITSVFTEENVLRQGAHYDDEDPTNWRHPFIDGGIGYRNDDGSEAKVKVVEDGDDWIPAVVDGVTPVWDAALGSYAVKPEELANLDDFLDAWESGWAQALLPYHPEYRYLEYYGDLCNIQPVSGPSIVVDGNYLSSEAYNNGLLMINSYKLAKNYPDENTLSTNFITSAAAGTHLIKTIDPYYNLNYEVIGDATAAGFDDVESNDYKRLLIDMVVSDYKDIENDGITTTLDIWEFAVKTVVCGAEFTEGCTFDASIAAVDLLPEEQQNLIWTTYKQTYLAEKRKIDQIFADAYAIQNGFYNGYINSDEVLGPNYFGFAYYQDGYHVLDYDAAVLSITQIYLVAIDEATLDGPTPWLENANVAEFAEKEQRFIPIYSTYDPGLPEADMLLALTNELDAEVYAKTGRCALSFDLEFFLNGLANGDYLAPAASVNAIDFPWLTTDLYADLGGSVGSYDVIISSSTIGGGIQITIKNADDGADLTKSIRLFNPSGLDWAWNWADVEALELVYYKPGSVTGGVYLFQILAKCNVADTYKEVILDGETEVAIGDCYSPIPEEFEDIICDKEEQFAHDLKTIFEILYQGGHFTTSLSPVNAATTLGGWYNGSEVQRQMGDNPYGSIATVSTETTFNRFTLVKLSEGLTLTVDFIGTIPSDILIVTGAVFESGSITIHYIDTDGDVGFLVADVTLLNTALDNKLNLSCMCDQEKALALVFDNLMNKILDREEFTGTTADVDYDHFASLGQVLFPYWDSQITTEVELERETGAITVHYTRQNPTDLSITTCAFEIVQDGGSPINLNDMNHIFHIRVSEGAPFTATGYAYIPASDKIIHIEIRPVLGDETGCFTQIDCGCSAPTLIPSVSCSEKFLTYDAAISSLNSSLPDDEQFREYGEEEFCTGNHAYSVEAYINYLNLFSISSTEDEYYISISQFGSTNLNGGFGELDGDNYPSVLDFYTNHALFPDMNWNTYINTIYIPENGICPPNALPYYPDFDFDYPCEMYTANVDTVNAKNQEEIYLAKLAQNFRERYLEEALASLVETFNVEFFDREYHYTLYYYDQAGNLIQTVPPKGVDRFDDLMNEAEIDAARSAEVVIDPEDENIAPDHSFETKYRYNSLNQLVWQSTPDGGESYFGYDKLGRLVVSQNAKQKNFEDLSMEETLEEQFSYTRYDDLGRIIEVGEMTVIEDVYGFNENGRLITVTGGALVDVSAEDFPINLSTNLLAQEEVTRTQYDELFGIAPTDFADYSADNTRNRITGVYYFETFTGDLADYDNATFYDYDVHGNVKEMLQDINDQHLEELEQDVKKVKYEYDLVSGNVKHVTYQKDQADQFIHEYEYDSDNRITNVRTSKDDVIWEQDAKYFYYNHGPLARTEIGDKKVQATDYAYTIQGWLKGVNSENLTITDDQGKDAKAGINRMNAKDAFGYSLHYFKDDYTARHGNDFLSYSSAAVTPENISLYNGNIREMYTASTNTEEEYIGTSHTLYQYDQLNRIKAMEQEELTGAATPTHTTLGGFYASNYSYDENGNLMTLNRWAKHGGVKTHIDQFDYHYTAGTNQLTSVDDALGASIITGNVDLADQADDNYTYDQIGQLIGDVQEEIDEIQWKVTGKVHKIIREASSTKEDLEFVYDAMGNRIIKIIYDSDGDLVEKTYYIRDAQGNVMSIYTLIPEEVVPDPEDFDLQLTERDIYGSSRLGTENINQVIASTTLGHININTDFTQVVGDRSYELSNHLGNVLQVVTDRKLAIDSGDYNPETGTYYTMILGGDGVVDYFTADVVSQSDYYPFGMMLPGRNSSEDEYRYGFNGMEMDDEVRDSKGTSYTTEFRQYDPRVGRWLSLDPLASKFPWMSPYLGMDNNPILLIDPTGSETDDNIGIDRKGNVTFYEKTDDNFDRLYATDKEGKITDPANFVQVSDKKLLPNLYYNSAEVKIYDIDNYLIDQGTKHVASSKNKEDVVNLFLFLSKNLEYEMSVMSTKDDNYTISTLGLRRRAPNAHSAGLKKENVLSMVHSHPYEVANKENEVEGLWGDEQVSRESEWMKVDYYTYIPKTGHLFLINKDGTHTLLGVADAQMLLKILK